MMHQDDLEMTYRCDQKWEDLTPVEHGRLCNQCTRVVVDVSAMTEEEFRAFERVRREQNQCIRARITPRGDVIFATPRPPVVDATTQPGLMRSPQTWKALSLAGVVALSLVSCGDIAHEESPITIGDDAAFIHFDDLNASAVHIDDPTDHVQQMEGDLVVQPEEQEEPSVMDTVSNSFGPEVVGTW